MSLTYSQYKSTKPHGFVSLGKNNIPLVTTRMSTSWVTAPQAGATPTTPVALSSSTTGALNAGVLPGTPAWIKTSRFGHATGIILVADRLSHQAGLSGTVTTTQTTNLPTAALTRYTSGVGVMMLVEQYSLVGTTQTTLSVSYTNSAGVAGRTSPGVSFGANPDRGTAVTIPIPLQVGDVGVRSVESVTLAGTTSVAGNFGIALVKPLAIVHSWNENHAFTYDNVRDSGAWFEGIAANACLTFYCCAADVNTNLMSGSLDLIKQV